MVICPKAGKCKPVGYCDGKEPHKRMDGCKQWYCPITGETIACIPSSSPSPEPKKPKVITLCGSSKFIQVMAVCRWLLEKDEGVVTLGLHFLPNWYPTQVADHLAEAEDIADKLNELHLRKIDMSDEIFVVDYQGYIGNDTKREIEYATVKGIPIRYYSKEELGLIVDGMISQAKEGGR